jgi:hypothetical protein
LGIEVAFSKDLFIFQRKNTLNLLKEIGKLEYKLVSRSIDYKCKLNNEDGIVLDDINQFQKLVSKLINLTITRLDISYPVSKLVCSYIPKEHHI